MKKIFVVFITLFAFLIISAPNVFAATQSELIQRVDSDTKAANALLDDVKSVKDTPEEISQVLLRDIPTLTQHLDESSSYYESVISTETDEQLKTILINIDNDVKGLSTSLHSVEDSINSGDNDAYDNALKQYDTYIDSLNTHIGELNSHYGVADYSWLAWPFWIALIISIVLLIMSRGSPVLPAEQLRNQFEFALFKSSLWPLGGSAISYFWFLGTPPGGTFYILWGPIGIGYFQFFRGLYTYVTLARPAINLAKKEEKAKLDALIRSDKFQAESMEEKVKEIEKRSGIINLGGNKSDKKDAPTEAKDEPKKT